MHHMMRVQLDASSPMVRVEVMTPYARVGGAERADERVVVYNCVTARLPVEGSNRPVSASWSEKAVHPFAGNGSWGGN